MTVLTSLGHSCFKLTADNGWTAVFDPYQDGSVPGLRLPRVTADAVYTSHDHHDHNAADLVEIRKCHEMPYQVSTLLTDHDEEGGKLRGRNLIHILSDGHETIAHLGDLGRMLEKEERQALSSADVILIPCGGYYTIDARQARKIIDEIQPGLAILMHYRNGAAGYEVLNSLDEIRAVIPELQCLAQSSIEIHSAKGIITLVPQQ